MSATLEDVIKTLDNNSNDTLETQFDILDVAEQIHNTLTELAVEIIGGIVGNAISTPEALRYEAVEGITNLFTATKEKAGINNLVDASRDQVKIEEEKISLLSSINQSVDDIKEHLFAMAVYTEQEQKRILAERSQEKLAEIEAQRELGVSSTSSGPGKKKGSLFGSLFSKIGGIIKNVLGFVSKIGLIFAGATAGVAILRNPEILESGVKTITEFASTVVTSLKPAFEYVKDEVFPVLIDLTSNVLETLRILFQDYIGPGLTAALPYVKIAVQALSDFFSGFVNFLENPKSYWEEARVKAQDAMLDFGESLANGIDHLISRLGSFINYVIESLANRAANILVIGKQAAEKIRAGKVEFGEKAQQRIKERNRESAARNVAVAETQAQRVVAAMDLEPGADVQLQTMIAKREALIVRSEDPFNDPAVDQINREIKTYKQNKENYSERLFVGNNQTSSGIEVNRLNNNRTMQTETLRSLTTENKVLSEGLQKATTVIAPSTSNVNNSTNVNQTVTMPMPSTNDNSDRYAPLFGAR